MPDSTKEEWIAQAAKMEAERDNLRAEIERLRAYIKQLDRREGEMAAEIERLRSENENMHDRVALCVSKF